MGSLGNPPPFSTRILEPIIPSLYKEILGALHLDIGTTPTGKGDERHRHRRLEENKGRLRQASVGKAPRTYRIDGEQEALKLTFAAVITVALVCRVRLQDTER